ncbi:caspase family protein [Methylibium rhizosphaerae]|uniref:caspase family protein n=1 Tax=Methylibium rhizosphaerae TaxID=2570323 RepID=UPI00112CD213|nr:caspase family protein [Methylibium rhizosphaerae]
MEADRRKLCQALAIAPLGGLLPRLAAAGEERKAALVIGNAAYKVGALKNPVNDAQAVAASLRALGFEVVLRENTSLRDMIEAFRQFSMNARNAGVRLVYYAGHGVQVKGRNYLLPVDTEIRAEDEVPGKSADLNELLDRLGANRQGINIVILDACRNNPFSGTEVLGPDGRRLKFRGATPAGLARVEAPLGSMVAFSTAPGGVALDNPGEKNSLYTKHLLAVMRQPGLPIELVFKQVRLGVARDTGRVQVPWESSSLTGDFCFTPGPGGVCTTAR